MASAPQQIRPFAGPHPTQARSIENRGLFERLRAVRRRLADKEGVPPYIVFPTPPCATWPDTPRAT